MRARLATLDWARHPLGPPEGWPPALRMALDFVLSAREPLYLVTKAARCIFPNDAFVALARSTAIEPGTPIDGIGIASPAQLADLERVLSGSGEGPAADAAGSFAAFRDADGAIVAASFLPRASEGARGALSARAQEAGKIGLFSIGVGEDVLSGSAQFWAIFGLPDRERMPVAEVEALVHPDDVEVISSSARRRGDKMPLVVEYRIRRADTGETRWIERRAEFERDEDGRAIRLLGIVQDVTERHAARAAMAALNTTLEQRVRERTAERDTLAAILEATDAFVYAIDDQNRWLAINRAGADEYERLFGVRPIVGDVILAKVVGHEADCEKLRALWRRAQQSGHLTTAGQLDTGRGPPRSYEMRFGPLRDASGRRVGTFQMATDISERERARLALRQAQDALRQSQKMEAIGQLTGGVAHDFNNLLTVIRSSADLLRRPGLVEEKRRRYIDAISDTADRAARLTAQLLAFARRQVLKPEAFDANARVDGVAEMLRTLLGARVTLAITPSLEPAIVQADAGQFDTALVNMAVNARDAMSGQGHFSIEIARAAALPPALDGSVSAGDFVVLTLSDSGKGIVGDDLGRIFEPFFTTKPIGKGTGLGLSQVYGFAKQSGGEIAVGSMPGEGTTFRLFLPAVGEITAPIEPVPAPVTHVDRKGRLLVVEDNPDVGELSVQLIQELGYETVLATSAAEALALLDAPEAGFELVFSDVVMPGMSGIELAQQLRASRPDLPVVLTSGFSHVLAEDADHGFPLLKKPYSAEDLASALRRARSRPD